MTRASAEPATAIPPPAPTGSMRPDLGMTAQDLDPLADRPLASPNGRPMLIAAGVIGAGLLICGIGLVFGGGSRGQAEPAPAGSAASAPALRGKDVRLGNAAAPAPAPPASVAASPTAP